MGRRWPGRQPNASRAVEQAVAERGYAFVALSGGTTPKQMGSILAREPYRSRIPWDRVHLLGRRAGFPSGHRKATRARPGVGSSIWCRSHRATSTPGTRPRNLLRKRPPPTRPCCASSSPSPADSSLRSGAARYGRGRAYGVALSEHRRPCRRWTAGRRQLRAKNGRQSADAHRAGAQRRPRDPLPGRRTGKADTLEAVLEGPARRRLSRRN